MTRIGSYHSTKEMDSLRIKKRRSFCRYSENVKGNAITFLEHYHDMTFKEAVGYLLEFNGYSKDQPYIPKPKPIECSEPEKIEFKLPKPNSSNRRVYAYLLKRGIAKPVIDAFVNAKLLYECEEHHNCIFVGRDHTGKAVNAFKRGTYDKDGKGFKGGTPGGDKYNSFRLPCSQERDQVYVFESPIDMMSYMTVYCNIRSNAVALCCLYDGTLEKYLDENRHLTKIVFCLDSDKWAKAAVEKMGAKYQKLGYEIFEHESPVGKDWNEYIKSKRSKRQQCR